MYTSAQLKDSQLWLSQVHWDWKNNFNLVIWIVWSKKQIQKRELVGL